MLFEAGSRYPTVPTANLNYQAAAREDYEEILAATMAKVFRVARPASKRVLEVAVLCMTLRAFELRRAYRSHAHPFVLTVSAYAFARCVRLIVLWRSQGYDVAHSARSLAMAASILSRVLQYSPSGTSHLYPISQLLAAQSRRSASLRKGSASFAQFIQASRS